MRTNAEAKKRMTVPILSDNYYTSIINRNLQLNNPWLEGRRPASVPFEVTCCTLRGAMGDFLLPKATAHVPGWRSSP